MKESEKKKKNVKRPAMNPAILTHLAAAQSLINKNQKAAQRQVHKARSIAMRKQTRLPAAIRASFCNRCEVPLAIGKNCRVRIRNGYAIFQCAACGSLQKFGGKRKTA